jgi:hypothetical protein
MICRLKFFSPCQYKLVEFIKTCKTGRSEREREKSRMRTSNYVGNSKGPALLDAIEERKKLKREEVKEDKMKARRIEG